MQKTQGKWTHLVAMALVLLPAWLQAQDGAAVAGNACAMCHQTVAGAQGSSPSLFELAEQHAPFTTEQLQTLLQKPQHAVAKSLVQESELEALRDYLNSLE